MNMTTVGLDLAKNVFHVVCLNEHNKEVKKKRFRRNQVACSLPNDRHAKLVWKPVPHPTTGVEN